MTSPAAMQQFFWSAAEEAPAALGRGATNPARRRELDLANALKA
jgi:hypothetical protein